MKKHFLLQSLLFMTCLSFLSVSGQEANSKVAQKNLGNNGQPNFITFNEKSDYKTSGYDAVFKEQLKLNAAVSFSKLKSEQDQIGYTHDKFQCFYKGIKVEFSTYTLHSKNEKVVSMSGELYHLKDLDIEPKISAESAFEKALKHVDAQEYLWDNDADAKIMEYQKPKGELVILPPMNDILKERTTDNMRLAYKFDIYATNPISRGDVYVDAVTGKIIFNNISVKAEEKENHALSATHSNRQSQGEIDAIIVPVENTGGTPILTSGNVMTRYSGSRNISFSDYQGDMPAAIRYQLFEATRGAGYGVETFKMTLSNYSGAVRYGQPTTAFSFNTPAEIQTKDNGALDAHWAAEQVYDFWYSTFGRNSFDNKGARIKNFVRSTNTFWNGTGITFEQGFSVGSDTYDMTACLDVAAHEFAHGVCNYTANLVYYNESNALNEGFSDIWAACVEIAKKPSPSNDFNWQIAEELIANNTPLRSLKNPNANGYPDTYLANQGVTYQNNGNAYHKGAVIAHWFYILSMGESGTNGVGNTYNVTGIGVAKAQQIAYRMESVYMTANTTYPDVRLYGVQSVLDLIAANNIPGLNFTNTDLIATIKSFYAVNLGADYVSEEGGGRISAPTNLAATVLSCNSIGLSWTAVSGIPDYNIYNGSGVLIATITGTSYTVTNLLPATAYSFTVKAKTPLGNLSNASNSAPATTSSGLCYCTPTGTANSNSYIDKIILGGNTYDTGQNGYTLNTTVNYLSRGLNSITYTPNMGTGITKEFWRIWIDFNRNGYFDNVNELIYNDVTTTEVDFTGYFIIPNSALQGDTRMRIMMRSNYTSYNAASPACSSYYISSTEFGEVEDYTINIPPLARMSNPDKITDVVLYPNPANQILNISGADSNATYRIVNYLGQEVMHGDLETKEINIASLANGVYLFEVEQNGNPQVKKFVKN